MENSKSEDGSEETPEDEPQPMEISAQPVQSISTPVKPSPENFFSQPIPAKLTQMCSPGKRVGKPRLMIERLELMNFKSYAGKKIIGPFHKYFTSVVGPNGSGKSNLIDSLMFVFGKRSKKLRIKKLTDVIHKSSNARDLKFARVSVHFQEIIDTGDGDDDFILVENSEFIVSHEVRKSGESFYKINHEKRTFDDICILLKTKGIDLDYNRFLLLQGEVESISLMKPTTSLYLKSKTNPKCILDLKHQVVGSYMEDEQGRDDYPKDAYMPLSNWYGGGGENIMIKLEDTKCFYVMLNPLEEGSRDYIGRGMSAQWEDYKPIAKVNYTLDEMGGIRALTCETYEVDYSSFFEENEVLPLELEFAIWERKTSNGPSSWYRIYLSMQSNRKEEVDLGNYLCRPEIIDRQSIQGVNLPEQTKFALKGSFEDQGILIEEYFVVYEEGNYLKIDYIAVNNGEAGVPRELYSRTLVSEQQLQIKDINWLDKPYRLEGSYHPVVYNNNLLGGSKNGMNYSYIEICDYMQKEESYRLYSLEQGYIKDAENPSFTLKQAAVMNGSGYRGEVAIDTQVPYLAVSGEWAAMPRIPKLQGNEVYQKFFPEGTILQNYRIDLEGDGQEEVVLIVKEDNEIWLILRKIGEDGSVHILRESMNKNTYGDVKLVGIADLQGDGTMEIVVESEEWGSPGYKVYSYGIDYLYEVFGDIEDIHCWH